MTEQLAFSVVRRFADAELRRYPEHVLIQVDVPGDFERAGNIGFGPLIRYISGNNAAAEKIPMTAPVVQHPHPGEIHTVSFVMPNGTSLTGAPLPRDAAVRRTLVPEHLVLARTFRGNWSERNFRNEQHTLERALVREGFTATGEPYFARFDPPWKPGFLRHNEVLVDIAEVPA